MSALAPWLVAASAAIPLAFGLMHLLFTFHGPKLTPRDDELQARMREVSPVVTRQTTMWKAWIGFNATHSVGLIHYGLFYGYLALLHGNFLFESYFLLALGLVLLIGYVVLARKYFFRTPLRGLFLATFLYAVALAVRFA